MLSLQKVDSEHRYSADKATAANEDEQTQWRTNATLRTRTLLMAAQRRIGTHAAAQKRVHEHQPARKRKKSFQPQFHNNETRARHGRT